MGELPRFYRAPRPVYFLKGLPFLLTMKNVWRYESPGENKPRMSASIPAFAAAIPRAPAGGT